MNGRSGIFTLALFLVLGVLVLMQVMLMLQSDRLFERVNRLEQTMGQGSTVIRTVS